MLNIKFIEKKTMDTKRLKDVENKSWSKCCLFCKIRKVEMTSVQKTLKIRKIKQHVKVYKLRIFDVFVKTSFQLHAFLQNRQHLDKVIPSKLRLLHKFRPRLNVYLTNFVPTGII